MSMPPPSTSATCSRSAAARRRSSMSPTSGRKTRADRGGVPHREAQNGETKRGSCRCATSSACARRRNRRTRRVVPLGTSGIYQMAIKSVIKRISKQLPSAGTRTPDRSRQPAGIGRRAARPSRPPASSKRRLAHRRARSTSTRRPRWPILRARACPRREPAADGDAIEMEQSAGLDAAMNASNESEKPEARADNGAPTVSYAQLMDMINRAQTLDDLAVAGDLISTCRPISNRMCRTPTAGGTSSSSAKTEHPVARGERRGVRLCRKP